MDATERLRRCSGGVPGPAPKSPMSLPLTVQVLTMALALLCFNIAGVYITKLQSATHRACVDATRQAVVWIHALLVGWEEFSLVEREVETKASMAGATAAQAADWPRLVEAPGSLRHDLALKEASGEPAGWGLSQLVFGIDRAVRLRHPRPRYALVQ